MKYSFRTLFVPGLICLALAGTARSSVIFKPGEKAHYMAPGEEQMSGSARERFDHDQQAEKQGDLKHAIKAYRVIVKKHPHDTLAPGSCFRMGQLQEQTHDYLQAAQSYAVLCQKYGKTEH